MTPRGRRGAGGLRSAGPRAGRREPGRRPTACRRDAREGRGRRLAGVADLAAASGLHDQPGLASGNGRADQLLVALLPQPHRGPFGAGGGGAERAVAGGASCPSADCPPAQHHAAASQSVLCAAAAGDGRPPAPWEPRCAASAVTASRLLAQRVLGGRRQTAAPRSWPCGRASRLPLPRTRLLRRTALPPERRRGRLILPGPVSRTTMSSRAAVVRVRASTSARRESIFVDAPRYSTTAAPSTTRRPSPARSPSWPRGRALGRGAGFRGRVTRSRWSASTFDFAPRSSVRSARTSSSRSCSRSIASWRCSACRCATAPSRIRRRTRPSSTAGSGGSARPPRGTGRRKAHAGSS